MLNRSNRLSERLGRRTFHRLAAAGLTASAGTGWLSRLAAAQQEQDGGNHRRCILLWMSGGPSQMETFDPKEGHENGGPTKSVETSVPGIRIAENLPGIAGVMDDLAVIRSMSTKEGDHSRATYFLRTGYLPQGPVRYPYMGSFLSNELRNPECDLPACISIDAFRAFSPAAFAPGFLGPACSAMAVESVTEEDAVSFAVRNLERDNSVSASQLEGRMQLLTALEHDFLQQRPGSPGISHVDAYQRAVRMMNSASTDAFSLDKEDDSLRDAYGRNPFGQGCLLARRLLEHGVSFVEVTLSSPDGTRGGAGWDTHADNFEAVGNLCSVLDPAWSTLMTDLKDRGLLDSTLVIWMGEFGRTPAINDNSGRDHWPGSWSAVLGGGGIRGGQAYGATSDDGTEVTDNPVSVPDLMATICNAAGVDHETTNLSNIGRPIPLSDHGAKPIEALLS